VIAYSDLTFGLNDTAVSSSRAAAARCDGQRGASHYLRRARGICRLHLGPDDLGLQVSVDSGFAGFETPAGLFVAAEG
jgi:hypothetical protein